MYTGKLHSLLLSTSPRIAAAWLCVALPMLCWASASSAQDAATLIIAPHEDDEVLMVGEQLYRALQLGERVTVAIVTNGDASSGAAGDPDIRIAESLGALESLGLDKFNPPPGSNVHFLGYGDGTLEAILNNPDETDQVQGPSGNWETFGSPVNNVVDYHSVVNNGSPGAYNRTTIVGDLRHIIQTDYPERVFLPSVYDTHSDHRAAGKLAIQALRAAKEKNPAYSPKIYEYLVHWGPAKGAGSWPSPRDWSTAAPGPCVFDGYLRCNQGAFYVPHLALPLPVLDPDERRSEVSRLMRLKRLERIPISNAAQERKVNAISFYTSQLGGENTEYLFSFVKTEEFFWTYTLDSLSYAATVTVSSEDQGEQQEGSKAIDGIIDGYMASETVRGRHNEWVTLGQTVGAWIRLTWDTPRTIDRVILYDRPNLIERILDGQLAFSTGAPIDIGPLSDDGSGDIFDFSPRTVRWVELQIGQAEGANIGLAEFEVFLLPEPAASLQLLAGVVLLQILARTRPRRG